MVLKHLTSDGLDGLYSEAHVNLLNAIDSLRSQGISHYISLPQIIVCGDQSSGKSSVLEAISGVAFPVKSNLCTRFPTELILRKTKDIAVKVSIVPHHLRNVVKGYRTEPRSVILAVVSAKNDYANQIVLKLAREADGSGTRTLGVITKPDTLSPGTQSEETYLSLARNQDVQFRLGWHILRNRDTDTESWTLNERDANESTFFLERAWSSLPSSQLGIKTLRDRLSNLLLHQIASELPELLEEIIAKLDRCQAQVDRLGRPRTNLNEQRIYLIQASQAFKHSEPITRDEYIGKVVKVIDRSRGRELPGMVSPMIVSTLFKEQSHPWKAIADNHLKKVWDLAGLFLDQLIRHVADETTVKNLQKILIEPALHDILQNVREKVTRLINSHQFGHPITYNKDFIEQLAKARHERQKMYFERTLRDALGHSGLTSSRISVSTSIDDLVRKLSELQENDTDRRAASKALDCMTLYYKVAVKRFTDDVAVEIIKSGLVVKISRVFSPLVVSLMSEDVITQIAGECNESRQKRTELERTIGVLQKGVDICKMFSRYRVNVLRFGQ
uniref:Putative dynamin-related GTPase domain protein n=1 Tax=Epichloe inebrians TaxID=2591900 RepID=J9SYK6_9HYPO|nr:putative dynamin-related GTPase domain protein [Epichloe inebrians]